MDVWNTTWDKGKRKKYRKKERTRAAVLRNKDCWFRVVCVVVAAGTAWENARSRRTLTAILIVCVCDGTSKIRTVTAFVAADLQTEHNLCVLCIWSLHTKFQVSCSSGSLIIAVKAEEKHPDCCHTVVLCSTESYASASVLKQPSDTTFVCYTLHYIQILTGFRS
jgi:hypothetical protein